MTIVDKTISYQQIIEWGALNLYDDSKLKRWWGDKEELSVKELLEMNIPLSRIMWVVFHLELPEKAVHQAGLDSARYFLDSLKDQHVYIDLRSWYALDKKQEWINGSISLGVLTNAQCRAKCALADVIELGDEQAKLGAKIAYEAAGADIQDAFVKVHYLTVDSVAAAESGKYMRDKLKAYLMQTNGEGEKQ